MMLVLGLTYGTKIFLGLMYEYYDETNTETSALPNTMLKMAESQKKLWALIKEVVSMGWYKDFFSYMGLKKILVQG